MALKVQIKGGDKIAKNKLKLDTTSILMGNRSNISNVPMAPWKLGKKYEISTNLGLYLRSNSGVENYQVSVHRKFENLLRWRSGELPYARHHNPLLIRARS